MCISIFCKGLSALHLFPPSCISQTWISILKRVVKSLLFLCGSISNKIAYRGLHSHGECAVIIGCPAVPWLMQTLHLSWQNHLSAGLEHSKQLNKTDQEEEDETEIPVYTSLIRQDEFSNWAPCFLQANRGKGWEEGERRSRAEVQPAVSPKHLRTDSHVCSSHFSGGFCKKNQRTSVQNF